MTTPTLPPLTEEDLAGIKERAEKATPGPWTNDATFPFNAYCDDPTGSVVAQCGAFEWVYRPPEVEIANAAFIAHARLDVPRLYEALEAAWVDAKYWKNSHALLWVGFNQQVERAEKLEAALRNIRFLDVSFQVNLLCDAALSPSDGAK